MSQAQQTAAVTTSAAAPEASPAAVPEVPATQVFMKYDLSVLEGMPSNSGQTIIGRAGRGPFTPIPTPGYFFRKEMLQVFLSWQNPITNPGNDGLYIFGPSAAGKTSFINEIAARVNIQRCEVTGHSRMEFSEFIGQFLPNEQGGLTWHDGPLIRAMRFGCWFILNEGDLVDPGVLVGLNEILEKQEILIPATREFIKAAPGFGFIITANTAGLGDDTGGFTGTTRLNLAFLDRFMKMEVNYMPEENEVVLVSRALGYIVEDEARGRIAKAMVTVANAIRDQFTGKAGGSRLEVTLSTRGLLRWALLVQGFKDFSTEKNGKTPFEAGMEVSLTAGTSQATKSAINGIIQRYLG